MYAYGNGHILASRMATKKSEIILPAWDYGGPLSKELKTHEFFAPQQIGLGRWCSAQTYSSLKKQLEHTCKSPLFWLPYKPSFPASFLSLSSKLVPKHRVTQHFAKLRLCAHVFLRGTLPKLRPGGSSAWLKTPCGYPNLPAESRFFWWAMKTKSPWNGSCNGKIIGKYRKITHLTEVLMGT